MTARLGADDIDLFATPRRGLLREVSGITPVEPNGHVLLDKHGVRSIQRLALADIGGGVVAGLWPAEMKTQALALYGHGLATPMIATARARGWSVEASPHIAFFNSTAAQRLYMSPEIDPADYARRWETSDLGWIRQYSTDEFVSTLWPWLKERGYASDADDDALNEFASRSLKRRPAHLRPGLRLKRRWSIEELRLLGETEVAAAIRDDVDAILHAAGEPSMPGSMH